MIINRYPQYYIDTLEAQEGTIIYNLDTNTLNIRSGLDWLPIASGEAPPNDLDNQFFIDTESDLSAPIEGGN